MTDVTPSSREDRVFVRDGRRHHRPRYSRAEFRIGVVVLGVLLGILGWVAHRGAHPDPSLFASSGTLKAGAPPAAGGASAVAAAPTPSGSSSATASASAPEASAGSAAPAAPGAFPGGASTAGAESRGPLPTALTSTGWTEGAVTSFGPDNLFEKVDGREDYYKGFGFRRLWCVSLTLGARTATAIDVEAYDLGSPDNAVGAFAGERPAEAPAEVGAKGLAVLYRNALYLARGPLYVRAIGSDESAELRAQLAALKTRFEASLPGGALPWAWALFAGKLALDPKVISYTAENAYSFGFARNVWSAHLADETDLFVIKSSDASAADTLAAAFARGFADYGDAAGTSNGVSWVQDHYIKTVSGAKALGPWTIGVHAAPDLAKAEAALAKLEPAVRSLPLESRP
ncbi:MAG: DUF6599 family protein [bacterium]